MGFLLRRLEIVVAVNAMSQTGRLALGGELKLLREQAGRRGCGRNRRNGSLNCLPGSILLLLVKW
jgi:hypothetical protein